MLMRAEGHLKVGEVAKGLNAISQALTHVEETHERYQESELYRLRGELLLTAREFDSAAAAFHQSLVVARKQGVRSWELRAATSLAHLWQTQGKTAEARDLLAPVYDCFTEGFDTQDLKDAKPLLEELG